MNKKGEQQAFPYRGGGNIVVPGMTYRQYLAGQIAGHMAANDGFTAEIAEKVVQRTGKEDGEACLRMYGLAVWALTDAVLEAEEVDETPMTHTRMCPKCDHPKVFTQEEHDRLTGEDDPTGFRCEVCRQTWEPFR